MYPGDSPGMGSSLRRTPVAPCGALRVYFRLRRVTASASAADDGVCHLQNLTLHFGCHCFLSGHSLPHRTVSAIRGTTTIYHPPVGYPQRLSRGKSCQHAPHKDIGDDSDPVSLRELLWKHQPYTTSAPIRVPLAEGSRGSLYVHRWRLYRTYETPMPSPNPLQRSNGPGRSSPVFSDLSAPSD